MPSSRIKDVRCQTWHSLNLDITIYAAPHPPHKTALIRVFSKNPNIMRNKAWRAVTSSALALLGNIRMSCVTALIRTLSLEIPSQGSDHSLWKCPLEQPAHHCVPIQSDLKSVLQPPLTPELCAAPPYADWLQAVSFEENPPTSLNQLLSADR